MRRFIKETLVPLIAERLTVREPILEVGSYQVKAQRGFADLRPLFPEKEYIGLDKQQGRGVDQIGDVHHLPFPENSIGTILAFDILEHVAYPQEAIAEFYRVLHPQGWLVVSTHMNFPIHYQPDYWRLTPQGMELLLLEFSEQLVISGSDRSREKDNPDLILGFGRKGKRAKETPPLEEAIWVPLSQLVERNLDLYTSSIEAPLEYQAMLKRRIKKGREENGRH